MMREKHVRRKIMISIPIWLFTIMCVLSAFVIIIIILSIIGFISEFIEYRKEIKLHGNDDR